ncbi:hypothetical protein BDV29DRAFT_158616 [Aspergillus leporis]|uniref:Heterokaryon incompatibility domain-containing protein n=1 Tax=Aspergillus leporis TaxID=41062 RepID=A0A5N5WYR0_9EURO|nr:hypothetical protein BDV29DRAFT_158616 [Aspergillus leporis]
MGGRVARGYGFEYLWMDTICINPSMGGEEASVSKNKLELCLNAEVCIAYLDDVSYTQNWDPNKHNSGERIKWFTRGWTLLELVATKEVIFLAKDWRELGRKTKLVNELHRYTNVDKEVLADYKKLDEVPVAHRMSWAIGRETYHPADKAYCLMGLFGVRLPHLKRDSTTFETAFCRVQKEIIKKYPWDLSIFAWRVHNYSITIAHDDTESSERVSHGLLAGSLSQFADYTAPLTNLKRVELPDYDYRKYLECRVIEADGGLYVRIPIEWKDSDGTYWANLNCYHTGTEFLAENDTTPSVFILRISLSTVLGSANIKRTDVAYVGSVKKSLERTLTNKWIFIRADGKASWATPPRWDSEPFPNGNLFLLGDLLPLGVLLLPRAPFPRVAHLDLLIVMSLVIIIDPAIIMNAVIIIDPVIVETAILRVTIRMTPLRRDITHPKTGTNLPYCRAS